MMDPNESFINWMNQIQMSLILVGSNIFRPGYKPNWCTFVLVSIITLYFIGIFYTMYIEMANDWKNALNCMCMFGTVFSGVIKFASGILHKKDMLNSITCLGDLYKEYSNKTPKFNTILKNEAKIFSYFLKIYFASYILSSTIIMVAPPLIYLKTGQMLFVLQYYIPGIDPFVPSGYWFTLLVHTISFIHGAIATYAADILFILFSYHIYVLSQIFKTKILELNDALDMDGNEKSVAVKVLDIARFHQDFCIYGTIIENMYFWNAFFHIGMSAFSICVTLFVIMCGDWPGAPVYLTYSSASMYLYCGMGTLVEYSCDEIVTYICNIKWYNLTPSQKRIYIVILARSQSPTLITVGGLVPLSVNTGLQVTKTIYSWFMMLLQFI